jgi:tryptophan synthase alpha chain
MNRIKQLFERKQHNILSVYFTAGYPKLDDTLTVIQELEKNDIDLVEIGIPFSDPMADGPVIQESGTRALLNGMSVKRLFEQLTPVRRSVHIPLVLMGYLNPIMQFGFENFCRKCRETGIDGAIVPDLPFDDYIREYKPVADRYDLKIMMLITPETSEKRIRLIDQHTDSFIYMVSSAATTGAQSSFDEQKLAYFHRINAMQLKNPRLIGFGISNRETFDAACANSSGAIIGSKFISLLKNAPDVASAVVALRKALE